MQGKVIDKLGRLILATAGVSFAAALGESIDGNNVTVNSNNNGGFTSLSPDSFDIAAASAVTDASNRLGKVLLDKYESFVPVVEILSNREGVAIFAQSAEISVLEEDEVGLYAASADFGY